MAFELPGTDVNTIPELLTYEATQVPLLGPLILLFIFLGIAGAGYTFSSKQRQGNFPMWMAISGLITTTIAFILFLQPGWINLETLAICVVVTFISAMFALFSRPE